MPKVNLNILVMVCVLIMALAGPGAADTHYVSPGQSIQAAIEAASDYDEIQVAPGTYNEAINFIGKAVRLYSSGGSSVTTINGTGHYHVVQCVSGEDANTILEGFTITGGNANGTEPNDRCGGGMFNSGSSPTVQNCIFSGNAANWGGGMYCHFSNPTIIGCTFKFNSAALSGGGLRNWQSSPSVTNSSFTQNTSVNPGGGMENTQYSSPSITGCTFSGNSSGYSGGGMNNTPYCNPSIINSTFSGNMAGQYGGGIANFAANPTITGCLFYKNSTGNGQAGYPGGAGENAGDGGGMLNSASNPIVSDCEFNENSTGTGGSGGSSSRFDIKGGTGGNGGNGGGLYNKNSSPRLTNCSFNKNMTGNGGNGGYSLQDDGGNGGNGGDGAGIYDYNSSPIMTNCSSNENVTGSGGSGGGNMGTNGQGIAGNGGNGGNGAGMYIDSNSSPVLNKCNFTENLTGSGGKGRDGHVAYFFEYLDPINYLIGPDDGGNGGNGGNGGGLCHESNLNVTVSDCTFTANKTGSGGLGGKPGKFVKYGSPGLNGTAGSGGGMSIHLSPSVVTNCIFLSNTASYGGGISNDSNNSSYNPTVTNCTFRQNVGKKDGGGIYSSGGIPTVTNCIFWDDSPNEIAGTAPNATYCDVEGGYAGTGNIDAPPAFADDDGRLSLGSICIDAGSNSAPNLPDKDLDGWPRIMGTAVDMGAFEYTADLRICNVIKDILYGSIQAAIDDANDGDEICVLPGTYSSAVDFKGKAVRLYSTSGPDFTTIDGSGAYHVVKCVSGENANTILEGFTITGGDANGFWPDDAGGGMFNSGSSPTVTNCKFIDNSGTYCGGMYNRSSNPIVTNCTFSGNTADYGGGMANAYSSSPTVTNCTFSDNHVSYVGGGMFNDTVSPDVTNCTFSGNMAGQYGGGMYNRNCSPKIIHCIFGSNQAQYGGGVFNNDNSNPIVTNCNFLYNSASGNGGGMFNYTNSNPTVTNCILWEDYATDEIYNVSSNPVVTYCDINMASGTYPGTGNINANPGFSGAIIAGRPECSYYLSSSASPCADAGDNNASNLPAADMGGQPRVIDGDVDGNSTVDIGAYELQPCVKNVTRNRWYQLIQHSVEDACENDRIEVPPRTYYESVDFMNAPTNFVLTSIDPNDPNIVEQTIIDAKFGGHVLTFTSQGPSCVIAGFTLTIGGNILMVPGFGYGIGSYGQMTSPTINNCVITNTRGVSLDNGSPAIRGCTIRENYGGIKVSNSPGSVVEDCIIANNFSTEGHGLYCAVETSLWGNTILRRCVVSGNLCEYTAISCGGNTTLEDCDIFGNTGMMGAVWSSSTPSEGKISGCTISNNKGSGINSWAGPIENSIITGNASNDDFPIWEGGGISIATGPITNCIIQGNKAAWGGGLSRCSGAISNCIITGNQGILQGGGLNNCDGAISNCTIAGNVAWKDEYGTSGLGGGLYGCSGTISNSIIWQNFSQGDTNQLYSSSLPSYSCIQDWSGGGTGNISADPCFIRSGYWADVNDPNIVVEPNNPNAVWADGFYRLSWASSCIDAGNNAAMPGGITTDLSGQPRFSNTCRADTGSGTAPIVDMGPYEFQAGGGIDGRGSADMRDFSVLASQWLQTGCGLCYGADLTCDGNVDLYDLDKLLDYWLADIQ